MVSFSNLSEKLITPLISIADTDSKEWRKVLQDRTDKLLAEKAKLEERRKKCSPDLKH